MHIHITGASGSGTTTLGLALAELLGIRHLDTDHFFWIPTDPPFTTQREVGARIAMLRQEALPHAGWVLSGSAMKWGSEFEPLYDLVVFLRIDPVARMERIRRREEERYGHRIRPGWRHGGEKPRIHGMGRELRYGGTGTPKSRWA